MMTQEDYDARRSKILTELSNKKEDLNEEFALSNNPYKKGDIIKDHMGSIKIESIGYGWGYRDVPVATYWGLEVKVNGEPKKYGAKRTVWQSNLLKEHK